MTPRPSGVPHGNAVLWRYTGLDKFLDVLLNRRLYFCSTDELTDKYESFLPPGYLKELRQRWRAEEASEDAANSRELEFVTTVLRLRSRVVVNSWSAGSHESYALWKIYLGGAHAGVAIRTTVARLRRALKPKPGLFTGELEIRNANYSQPPSSSREPV